MPQLSGWSVINQKMLEKQFQFKNFKEALWFLNKVGEIAESENHHPDMELYGWNKVKLRLSTHESGGLTVKDYSLAEKIDAIKSV